MRKLIVSCGRVVSLECAFGTLMMVLLSSSSFTAQTAPSAAPPKQAPATPKQSPAAPKQAPAANAKTAEQADLPSAQSIIDRHIKAIGGRGAILTHKSTHAVGTISMPATGITGPMDVYGAAPNKSFVKISLGGVGDIVEGFDGTYGWTLQPMLGPMLKQGKELAEKKFDSEYYSDLYQAERYASMKTIEKADFDGRPCYKVSLARKDGGEDIEYYDANTGLRAGTIQTRESPMGSFTATQVITEYKNFSGLLIPTTVKLTTMNVEQVIKITSVEFDNVPPSTFDLPAQIKALIK
jgi:hypothetical protein